MTEMLKRLQEVVRNVESAEKLALAGTYEHDLYVKAALMSAWPTIKAYVHLEAKTRAMISS